MVVLVLLELGLIIMLGSAHFVVNMDTVLQALALARNMGTQSHLHPLQASMELLCLVRMTLIVDCAALHAVMATALLLPVWQCEYIFMHRENQQAYMPQFMKVLSSNQFRFSSFQIFSAISSNRGSFQPYKRRAIQSQ
jgi:hypothetical protein